MSDLFLGKDLLVFDLDGTLVNSNENELSYFFLSLEQIVGHEVEHDIDFYPERTFAAVINSIDHPDKAELMTRLGEKICLFAKRQSWSPIASAVEVLEHAKGTSLNYYIVTGNYEEASQVKLESACILVDDSKLISTSLECDSKAALIEKLITQENVSREAVLSFGDSQYDAHVAASLGIDFVLLS